jgi:hypothetical protein
MHICQQQAELQYQLHGGELKYRLHDAGDRLIYGYYLERYDNHVHTNGSSD